MRSEPDPTTLAARPSRPASARAARDEADDRPWQSLDRQLCFALHSASLAMTKLYTPLLRPLGLTYPQYLVMLALWESGPSGVAGLGERLFLDSGTLTPLLKRLEAAGQLVRARDPADERRVIVTLTPAGRALRRRAAAVPRRIAAAATSADCPLEELGALTRRLGALRARLVDAAGTLPGS